ncbi:hypothetical protein JB92DRAFT_2826374 [Gautieria morchelliformis]|nr:hypothetical protein JB92DRAFT_2826374 [Gautieria morchelliformis]
MSNRLTVEASQHASREVQPAVSPASSAKSSRPTTLQEIVGYTYGHPCNEHRTGYHPTVGLTVYLQHPQPAGLSPGSVTQAQTVQDSDASQDTDGRAGCAEAWALIIRLLKAIRMVQHPGVNFTSEDSRVEAGEFAASDAQAQRYLQVISAQTRLHKSQNNGTYERHRERENIHTALGFRYVDAC